MNVQSNWWEQFFEGVARVFEDEEACVTAVRDRSYKAGEVLVIRNEGPVGGPGMREMLGVTALIYGQQMGEKVALLTDGRFSGATRGICPQTSSSRRTLFPGALALPCSRSDLRRTRSSSMADFGSAPNRDAARWPSAPAGGLYDRCTSTWVPCET